MENKKKNAQIIGWIIAIVIILGGGAWFLQYEHTLQSNAGQSSLFSSNASSTASTASSTISISSSNGSNSGIVKIISDTTLVEPDLDRSIAFPAGTGSSTEAALTTQITSLESALKANPALYIDWMQLGTDRKVIQDYQAAASIWLYVSQIAPSDFASLGNLADLYAYYLHNNSEAELYYAQAIQRGPTQEYLYFNAADFYLQVENSQSKALAVAEQGLKANPGNQDLENLVKSLQ